MTTLLESLAAQSDDPRILVGPGTRDDAGVFRFGDRALVATADFITPVCDDAHRFGRVAAANALSDVYAMGGKPLLALNLCCFPEKGIDDSQLAEIIAGAAETVNAAGAVVIGGHTVRDDELKFGLSVVGEADPDRLLTNAGAQPGQEMILTKKLGTGLLINAVKAGKLSAEDLDPALTSMERLNDRAAAAALELGATGATDVTGFGLVGHGLEIAEASGVTLEIELAALPRWEAFEAMHRKRVGTGATAPNREAGAGKIVGELSTLDDALVHDPQTSGGLLLCVPRAKVEALLARLHEGGDDDARRIGRIVQGPAQIVWR